MSIDLDALRVDAHTALDTVQRSPREAVTLADAVLVAVRGHRTSAAAEARAVAGRAKGLALGELGEPEKALRVLRTTVVTAEREAAYGPAASARLTLGFMLAQTGRATQALSVIDAALPMLSGADVGRARMQRGVALYYSGRWPEAMKDYDAAIEVARREGDALGEARALNNRASLQAYVGAPPAADADFARAAEVFASLGLDVAAADVRWNRAILAAQRGDVPAALSVFAEVEREHRRLDVPRPQLLLDRFELLLSVPLVDEARELAASAVAALRDRGMDSDLAEALLASARAALASGDLVAAVADAGTARRRFQAQRRPAWQAFARHVELRARLLLGERTARLMHATVAVADTLQATGWSAPALGARIDAASIATGLGRVEDARAQLMLARDARRGGTATRRAQGWHAEALLRRIDGDDRAAERALRRGLDVLDEARTAFGTADLRASAGAHGEPLARVGLTIALERGEPAGVLGWAERWRAGALRMTPARPPEDPDLAAALTALRAVSTDITEGVLAGTETQTLRREQVRLEAECRDLYRRSVGGAPATLSRPPAVRALAEGLGESVLVELLTLDGILHAVTVRDGRAALHMLGELAPVAEELTMLRFGLRRLASTVGRPAASTAARAAAEHAARSIDARLLAPLADVIADRAVVLVPTGALHAVPWSMLPSCHGRDVTVAPSAAMWLRAASTPESPTGSTVLAAGPGLPAARPEVVELARTMPGSTLLVDDAATAEGVTRAMDGAGLAHVAAHGTFRSDNPLFSALELSDGPLTVYDLERLRTPPRRIVLSACDSGLPTVRPGDELIGFAAALLGIGTRTLVATVAPVPDEASTPLVLDLHRRMRAGITPARALAESQQAYASQGDLELAASAGFVCYGAA